MPDFSRQEAATKAGVSLDDLNEYVELGVLTPGEGDRFSAGDVRRIGILQTFERAGVPREGMSKVLLSGEASLAFLDHPIYERFAAMSSVTFRELSASTGVPVESLMVIREAAGGVSPQPDDVVREDELAVVPMLQMQVAESMNLPPGERLLRVMGDSLSRVAQAQADWWLQEVMAPLVAKGVSAGNVGDATEEIAERFVPVYQQAFEALQHAHESRTWAVNLLAQTELVMSQAGLYSRQEHPPAMCFFDITGYTRLTQERGDAAAAELATTFGRMVQRTSSQYAGRAVKWLGDGVMFYFASPGPGVVAALDMMEGAAEAGLPPAHVGLHAGPVLFQEGDYFGQTVNVAARIADYARPGEVLVSQAVVEASEGAGAAFTEIGPVELKGVTGATQLHVARRG